MDKVQAEFDACAAILGRMSSQRAALHSELSRLTDAESLRLLGRIEPVTSGSEWQLARNGLVAEHLSRYSTVLLRLNRQSERADHTLRKMGLARAAMSWRVREIEALLDELRVCGIAVTAEDISMHLWNQMLNKLNAKHGR